METDLFNAGQRPALNTGISVSRVGSSAQTKGMSQVAGTMRLDLAQFSELEAFSQFASDLDKATKSRIERGRHTLEILKQPQYQPVSVERQIMIIYAVTHGFLDEVPLNLVSAWESGFYRFMDANYQDLISEIVATSVTGGKKMGPDLLKKLDAAIEDYQKTSAPSEEEKR